MSLKISQALPLVRFSGYEAALKATYEKNGKLFEILSSKKQ
jgi:hypothetical protein